MNLNTQQTFTLLKIIENLSTNLDIVTIRQQIAEDLLALLDADYYASYVWDPGTQTFGQRAYLNMNPDNLNRYETYYQFHDPITHTLQQFKRAVPVSKVMPHRDLIKTEFFNDFLYRDGLYFGINLYAYDGSLNIGDLRIWRNRRRSDFSERDIQILELLKPHFTNALRNIRLFHKAYELKEPDSCALFIFRGQKMIQRNQRALDLEQNLPPAVFKALLQQIKTSLRTNQIALSFGIFSLSFHTLSDDVTGHPLVSVQVYRNAQNRLDKAWLMAVYRVTQREAEIVLNILEGLSDEEIAQKCHITFHTVRSHVKNIFLKLNVNSRTELVYKLFSSLIHIDT